MASTQLLKLALWDRRTLPVLLQTETAECGLACLAMVSSYWGRRIDLSGMRRRFSVSLKGANLRSLIAMGQALGLRGRPLKLGLEHLKTFPCPACCTGT